jgi:hypothetical protein
MATCQVSWYFEQLNIKVYWILPLSGYVFWSRVFIVPRYRKKYNIKIDIQTNIDSVSVSINRIISFISKIKNKKYHTTRKVKAN